MTEDEWWASLRGEEMELNISGSPPYDLAHVAEIVKRWLGVPSGAYLLDFGCGTGRLARALLDRAPLPLPQIIGVDVNPEAMTRFRLTTGCLAYHGIPAFDLDGAYSVTVFQHLQPAVSAAVVSLIAELLQPRSRLVFQFVVGTEDVFASHQVSEWVALDWVRDAGLKLVMMFPDERCQQWRWVVAEKGSS